jgi:acyl-CoA synthetase (AMP-forming)/AMP-acid ligase II
VHTDGFEGMTICCAYVPPSSTEISHSDLRQRLTAVLPSYMLPSQWLALESLPLNANGKIDRPRLRERFLELRTAA